MNPETHHSGKEIKLKNLNKNFGAVTALADVELKVGKEKLLSLVGPSGCGKTTTLRLIAGFDSPDSGDILIEDRSIINLPPEKRNIGVVFQNYALFPHLSVSENIGYGLRFQETDSKKERTKEMLSLVDMEELADRSPDQLSAGQKQRVSLARSLAPAPEILLLDEPLSALDQKLRERLKLEIKTIHEELNLTTFWVTHDQAQALSIADSVAVMNRGKIEQVGSPKEIYRKPKNEFTARFIGKGNLLDGKVEKVHNSKALLRVSGNQKLKIKNPGKNWKKGREVYLLVRPEDFELSSPGTKRKGQLSGKVFASEFLGDSTMLHVSLGDEKVLAKIDLGSEGEFSPGEKLTLSIQKEPHLI